MPMNPQSLINLGKRLKTKVYQFTTVTPLTHARVLSRAKLGGLDCRDILGWNRPFDESDVSPELFQQMDAGIVEVKAEKHPKQFRSKVRFSSLDSDLYCHSAFPTQQEDAIFFGPDTYRFTAIIKRNLADPLRANCRIVDVGCGPGAGGIAAVRELRSRGVSEKSISLMLTDINPDALAITAVNAALAGVEAGIEEGDVLSKLDGEANLILANPPYLIDAEARIYRHGGGQYGMALAERIVSESIKPRSLTTPCSISPCTRVAAPHFVPIVSRHFQFGLFRHLDMGHGHKIFKSGLAGSLLGQEPSHLFHRSLVSQPREEGIVLPGSCLPKGLEPFHELFGIAWYVKNSTAGACALTLDKRASTSFAFASRCISSRQSS